MESKKYGLQLRIPPTQKKRQPARPPLAKPLGFGDDENDDNVEKEISRQAMKTKAMRDYEEQHKKALEEDPNVFDYDGVYDDMKESQVRPRAQERDERKPKYIQKLIEKAEKRKWEQEIVYEKKLAKERSKEDHMYAGKDKFVTNAYKKKLAEQAKWMEEERLRQLKEEKDDVTRKSDLTDFYFNLEKNVAFGARGNHSRKTEKQAEAEKAEEQTEINDSMRAEKQAESRKAEEERELKDSWMSEKHGESWKAEEQKELREPETCKEINNDVVPLSSKSSSSVESTKIIEGHESEMSVVPKRSSEDPDAKSLRNDTAIEITSEKQSSTDQPKREHHKRDQDALAAAKERFLARQRAKEQ